MALEFPIIVVDEDDAPAKKEDQIAEKEPTVSAGATQSSWSAFYASMNLVSANVYWW